jgi:hypothetical protein
MPIIKIECPECKGTGLFIGRAEKNGAATICYKCKGTGCSEFSYEEFCGRKTRLDVDRVYLGSFGYAISAEFQCGIEFSKYGCTYQEWLEGKEPLHIEELYCPYIAYNEGIGKEPCVRCQKGTLGKRISDCKHYYDKKTCWEEYKAKDSAVYIYVTKEVEVQPRPIEFTIQIGGDKNEN